MRTAPRCGHQVTDRPAGGPLQELAGKLPFRAGQYGRRQCPPTISPCCRTVTRPFAAGDLVRLGELFADGIIWHVPGRNPLSGHYRGKQEVLALFGSWPTRPPAPSAPRCTICSPTTPTGWVIVTATRADGSLTVNQVNVLHLSDGKVTEGWIASTDQQAEDEFWA